MRSLLLALGCVLASLLTACGGGGGSDEGALPGWNLDFHGVYSVPDTYGAATGQAGTWVNCEVGSTSNVKNVDGDTTPVQVLLTGAPDSSGVPTTDTGRMMAGSVGTQTFMTVIGFSCTIRGLPAGTYDLVYYHFGPTSGLTCNGTPMDALTAGASALEHEVLGAQGTNWDAFRVTVAAGESVEIVDTTLTDFYGLSGLQIVPVAP